MKHPTLYKRATSGNVQVWWMETDIDRYCTKHGVEGGEIVTSEWRYPDQKNVGKANETSIKEQMFAEVESQYTKKTTQGMYTANRADIDKAKQSYFKPMLAKPFDGDRIDSHFYIQPKFNGIRCIATKDGLFSRNGKEFVNTPHISDGLRGLFINHPNLILDGELYNHDYRSDFNSLASAIRKTKPTTSTIAIAAGIVQYYLYDCFDGTQPKLKFSNRFDLLTNCFYDFLLEPHYKLSKSFRSSDLLSAKKLHERNKADGYEGSIIRLDAPYENTRTFSLMKYKDFQDAEFEILDIVEGVGNWSGVAKSVKLALPKGVTSAAGDPFFHAGVKGDKAYCRKLLEDKKEHIGKLGTIVFFDYTPDGVPLFPIFHAVRDYE